MGDLKALVERAEEAIKADEVDVNALMKGKFTLRDMYTQSRGTRQDGPAQADHGDAADGQYATSRRGVRCHEYKMVRYRIIMDSMTPAES